MNLERQLIDLSESIPERLLMEEAARELEGRDALRAHQFGGHEEQLVAQGLE